MSSRRQGLVGGLPLEPEVQIVHRQQSGEVEWKSAMDWGNERRARGIGVKTRMGEPQEACGAL